LLLGTPWAGDIYQQRQVAGTQQQWRRRSTTALRSAANASSVRFTAAEG